MSTRNSDTRLWKVDHLAICSQYIGAMIVSSFTLGALNFATSPLKRKQNNESIMVIGLGGGRLDMFFSKQFPQVFF